VLARHRNQGAKQGWPVKVGTERKRLDSAPGCCERRNRRSLCLWVGYFNNVRYLVRQPVKPHRIRILLGGIGQFSAALCHDDILIGLTRVINSVT
jgi:hypothetical protein